VELFEQWANQARSQLGTEPRYPLGLRGTRCPLCKIPHLLGQNDIGETIRVPVLQFEWPRALVVAENELPRMRTVRSIACQNCGQRWWAGAQFHLLEELIDEDRQERDTPIVDVVA
jgi:hypothetical protein